MEMMRKRLPASWGTLRATLQLLYRSNPRAFVVSALASLPEPLFFPAFLLVLHQMLQAITGPAGQVQLTLAAEVAGIALVALLMVQRLGIIVRDASSTILRQDAWVAISKRIMDKLPAVPYSLFENNALRARSGLVIGEASQRSITLVDTLFSTGPILLGLLGLAIAMFAIAPLMVLVLLVIAIPAARIERRFSQAMYELQEHTAPAQLRMDALTNMQVDAPWQRDVRVYRSNLLGREHAHLADTYLADPNRLTPRFLRLPRAAPPVQALLLAAPLAAVFMLIGRGQLSLASLAVLVPGVALLSGMIGTFISHVRSLLESLRYAQTLFDFLTTNHF